MSVCVILNYSDFLWVVYLKFFLYLCKIYIVC